MASRAAAPFILRLAFRNLSRHRRRTGLTVGALAFGIALMVLGQAWTDAMERAVVEPAKNATLGHVQIYRSDAAAEGTGEISFIMPQNNYRLIENPAALIEKARRIDSRIHSGLSRLMVGSLLSFKEATMDGVLIGIDPGARASTYPDLSVVEGRHFVPGENGVLINRGVARKLGIGPGDDLVALGTTSDGRLNGTRLRVTGIYTIKGLEAYEWGSCYADLSGVQQLLDAPDQAGVVVLRIADAGREAASVRDRLNAAFRQAGTNATAFTWEDMGGPFIGGMLVTRFIATIMNFVMGVIVAAGVLNTVLMATFERTREMGTMRAMGASKRDVLSVFLSEGFFLGLLGAALGALLGAFTIVFFSNYGIPAFSEAQKYTYGGDRLFPRLRLMDVVQPPLVMLAVSVLAAFIPSFSAARQRPGGIAPLRMSLGPLDLLAFGATGALTGLIGALLGLGGGVFLVPLLALGFGLEPRTAVAASLVAVIASSSSTTIVNMKRNLVNVPLAFTLLLATSLGSLGGGAIAHQISTRTLYSIFSSTLFIVALIVTSRSKSRNVIDDSTMDVGALGGRLIEEGKTLSYRMKRLPLALVVSLMAGAISGLLGVGGGVIQVPVLNSFCGIPIRVAGATSAFMIGPTAAVSAFIYLGRGDMNPLITAAVALGSLPGSILGAWLSRRIPVRSIKGILATSLVLVAVRLAIAAFKM